MGFEEVYRVAGIKSPKQGYSITKVIEMLQSEHIRSLGADTKRASLLMALEAAGIQIDEVLQDATLRQRAVNSYEAIQRKHLEEYEARKAQESCAIQAEMERVAAEYAARISNNPTRCHVRRTISANGRGASRWRRSEFPKPSLCA